MEMRSIMKKTLLLAAALACSGAVAQEKQIWACQQVEGTLLDYRNGRWEPKRMAPVPLLLTIDGGKSSYKAGESELSLSCSEVLGFREISCVAIAGGSYIFFNPENGRMGISSLLGATSTAPRRDSVSAEIYNCTKF
jgi:hypothetical protein